MSEAPQGPQFDAPSEGSADRDEALLARFDRWNKDLQQHWGEWREQAQLEYDFIAGRQWDEDDKAAMEESGKVPVVFNLSAPTIDAVSGAEIQNRQQIQYYPREVGDTGVADALTQGAEYVSDECNGDQEDSEAFRDALICGMGWTETRPEVDGSDTAIITERVDPLQIMADPSARKACVEDARYLKRETPMSRDDFEDFKEAIGKPDAEADDAGLTEGKRLTVVNPTQRYRNGLLGEGSDDEVIVEEWQWWEKEPVHLTAIPNPQTGVTSLVALAPDQHAEAQKMAKQAGIGQLKSNQVTRKVYYRAIVGAGEVLLYEPLDHDPKNGTTGQFRWKCITGKRDRTKGTWFGLVRPMMDPQRFTNKIFSQVLHIVRSNANGGMMAEEDAIGDISAFEQTWAHTDEITWLKPGALSNPNGPKMVPKSPPPVPQALFQLMEFARDMVQKVTGVNDELLGLVGREQAGVLEYQRTKQAYGLLSPFFDAQRRYRRDLGKLRLAMIRLYLPQDKLVRVVDQGTAQYVPLAETLQAQEYDIIVDDAPSSPNQKAKVMATLMPLLPELFQAGVIGPQEIADILPYTDLPASVANKLSSGIQERMQNPAMQIQQSLEARTAVANIDKTNAQAEQARATAFEKTTHAHMSHAAAGQNLLDASKIAEAERDAPYQPQGPQGPSASTPAAPMPQQTPGQQ